MFCSSGFLLVESASDSRHGLLEVLLVGKDLLLVGVLFLRFCPLDDGDQDDHIHHQGNDGHHTLGGGVSGSGPDGGVHEDASVNRGDGGEDAVVLEWGGHPGEHAPQSQSVGTGTDPSALVPESG